MSDSLKKLVKAARGVEMTEKQRENQRRSFAFGNTNIENERITRSMIDEQAALLSAKHG